MSCSHKINKGRDNQKGFDKIWKNIWILGRGGGLESNLEDLKTNVKESSTYDVTKTKQVAQQD